MNDACLHSIMLQHGGRRGATNNISNEKKINIYILVGFFFIKSSKLSLTLTDYNDFFFKKKMRLKLCFQFSDVVLNFNERSRYFLCLTL